MKFPLIHEYSSAILVAENSFNKLKYLRPVINYAGRPVMSCGSHAVIFKMTDGIKDYALKCFLHEQEGRDEAYRMIVDELEDVHSSYLVAISYYDKELHVTSNNTMDTVFPVLLMDWVNGVSLDKYISQHINSSYTLQLTAYHFCNMAMWLLTQSFAHGDIQPDNIRVTQDGQLILIDYDGMYVPAMKGQKARELGSPDYRHPSRTENDFNEHIDDFALASIALSLKAISLDSSLFTKYHSPNKLLFSAKDYQNISTCPGIQMLINGFNDADLSRLYALVLIVNNHASLSSISFKLLAINKPNKKNVFQVPNVSLINNSELLTPFSEKKPITQDINTVLNNLMKLHLFLKSNDLKYILTGSLGLYIHGFTPKTYIPHDIDVIIATNNKSYNKICEKLQLAESISNYQTNNHYYSTQEKLYSFCIGNTLINAFVYTEEMINEISYNRINVYGICINVACVLYTMQKKLRLKRLKDYLFNTSMQQILNKLLTDGK